MQAQDEQIRVAQMMRWGFLLSAGGGLVFIMCFVLGGLFGPLFWAIAGLAVLAILVGLVLLIASLARGSLHAFGDDTKKPMLTSQGAYISAKLILDKRGEPIYDPEMYDEEEIRRLVQVIFANGRKEEFRASEGCFHSIGEGMKGTITHQGKWITSFQPEIKPQDAGRDWGPDPFLRQ